MVCLHGASCVQCRSLISLPLPAGTIIVSREATDADMPNPMLGPRYFVAPIEPVSVSVPAPSSMRRAFKKVLRVVSRTEPAQARSLSRDSRVLSMSD
ncbi:hypothetical protein CYLTODRAFT_451332 [Cylindrobasidium torrendii FP15055 ss-10]|uniref:Uncharacterized protein n=1 Tax=Cylindrobasidium torrendii FP15055 ss-10 TaxID=1314674 RepID=A0A0D7BK40_9AGAR|nr:hypothetical protein CYLTODRAFT_451332 [Cylindrobasidium torrendii FP15055 ss-10]